MTYEFGQDVEVRTPCGSRGGYRWVACKYAGKLEESHVVNHDGATWVLDRDDEVRAVRVSGRPDREE